MLWNFERGSHAEEKGHFSLQLPCLYGNIPILLGSRFIFFFYLLLSAHSWIRRFITWCHSFAVFFKTTEEESFPGFFFYLFIHI